MSIKTYWNLLVLFSVFCQGIISTLSEKDTDESSDLLIRQKRVINLLPSGDIRQPLRTSPCVVTVKRLRFKDFCAGVILTRHTVLTAAHCVSYPLPTYRVYSGSAQFSRTSNPVTHNVTSKKINIGNHPFRPNDGIALITVTPSFTYSVKTHNINLYKGHVHTGLYGTVAGWGCNPTGPPGTAHPERLREITVPIISIEDCNILYLEHYRVSDIDICTLDAFGHRYCGDNDAGAPLIFEVNHVLYLAGIHLWSGGIPGRSNPDVFVNLQHPIYKSWILETISNLEAHLLP